MKPNAVQSEKIGIVGAGAAGLITAHTLLQDGFTDVQILTRDSSPGGIWCAERIYPSLSINNVDGEYRFSHLKIPASEQAKATGLLSGDDMRAYMEMFARRFLPGRIRYRTEVLNIRLEGGEDPESATDNDKEEWVVTVKDTETGVRETLKYDKIVLCTGGCSEPLVPSNLSSKEAEGKGFTGMVVHSCDFFAQLGDIMPLAKPYTAKDDGGIVIVGGGKSAQDVAEYLANQGKKVTVICSIIDPAFASPFAMPNWVRRSRVFSVLSPHIELRTRLERFLHTTRLGSTVVHGAWDTFEWLTFKALKVPKKSPLRNTRGLFWTLHTNTQGRLLENGFHAHVNQGHIDIIVPARAVTYTNDSVVLSDGRQIKADVVILATGFTSSWEQIIDRETMDRAGFSRHTPVVPLEEFRWNYRSLSKNAPQAQPEIPEKVFSIYRGIVPAKSIHKCNLAINGAIFSISNGFMYEITSHWISSYFLKDPFLKLPPSVEEALKVTDKNAAWLRKRYPHANLAFNETYSSDLAFWCWPQMIDRLLEDMSLTNKRGGGNAFTWPFKTLDLKEIENLGIERAELRTRQNLE